MSPMRVSCRWRIAVVALVTVAASLAWPAGAGAQTSRIRFDHLSLEDGLSQSTVTYVFQDSRGYMWFGTQDGLNRFDGYRIQVFKRDPGDPESLPHNHIRAIVEDAAGDLWVATQGGGIARRDHRTGKFSAYQVAGASVSGQELSVSSLQFDRSGSLWIGTFDSGLHLLDPATGRTRSYRADPAVAMSLSDDRIGALYLDRTGALWVGTYSGLNRYDETADGFVRYDGQSAGAENLGTDRVRSILQDRSGTLWLGTFDSGLVRFEPRSRQVVRFRNDPEVASSLPGDRIYAMLQDRNGRLYVGTDGGLGQFDSATGSFARHEHVASDPTSLSHNDVRSLYQDEGGVVWVGTQGQGLSKWNPVTASFRHYRSEAESGRPGLSNDTVSSFSEGPEGRLWIGTVGGGLNRLDRASGAYTVFVSDPDDPRSLNDNRVMALAHDTRGVLWVGTLRGGLNRYDPATTTFRAYKNDPADPTSLSRNGVTTLLVDHEGTLWVGTYGGGLNRFDAATESFTRFAHDPADPTSLSDDRVTAIAEDRRGKLWVGTERGGLSRYDRATGTFARYQHDPAAPASLSSNFVMSVYADAGGILWVGTQGSGLNRLDTRGTTLSARDAFRRYSERDGLPNDVIYGIEPGVGGELWLSTNRGLSRFDPGPGTFTNYDVTHGLQSDEFNGGAHYRSPSGELFFGGFNGFNAFRPEQTRANRHAASLVLASFSKFNKPVALGGELSDLGALELSYRDSVFSFEVALLDYTAPEKNRYSYKLEGFSSDWIDLGSMRNITLTNLDPGSYTLRVKGANNDGTWSRREVALPVTISPPPWQTWWAYGLYGLLAVSAGTAYINAQAQRLRRKELRSRQLEQQVQERTAQLAEQNVHLEERRAELAQINGDLEQEVAEHERTGQALRASEQRYLDLYDHAPDMFATVDADTARILQCNLTLAGVLGRSRDTIVGMNVCDLHHPEWGDQLNDALERVRACGEVSDVELRLMRIDGSVMHASLNMRSVRDTDTGATQCRLVWRDITERNRLEEQLRHAEQLRAIGQLAGGVAHEFNNLLMGIHGFSDLLSMSVSEPGALEDVDNIRQCADRAANLTGQLLTFSRRQPIRPELVDLNDCVRRGSTLLGPLLGEVIEFEIKCGPDVGKVRADPGQLQQILMNLAINARDAMPRGGRLTFETDVETLQSTAEVEAGRYARLTVVDTGEGIDEETLSHVFEPFFTTKEPGKGAGLGLAMVYGAIKQHSGHLLLDSQPDKGTTVSIYLPLAEEAA